MSPSPDGLVTLFGLILKCARRWLRARVGAHAHPKTLPFAEAKILAGNSVFPSKTYRILFFSRHAAFLGLIAPRHPCCLRRIVPHPPGPPEHTTCAPSSLLSFTTIAPMKLLPVLTASLALALSAHAQYFSQGWQPGQPVTEEARPTLAHGGRAQQPVPTAAQGGKAGRFDFKSVLTSGPVDFLASKMGLNMTEKLAQAEAAAKAEAEMWDPRIPVITDASYEEVIVREPLTLEEESERVWFLVMCVHAALRMGISLTGVQLGLEGWQERCLAKTGRLL